MGKCKSFVKGLVIGGGLGLLFAPKSGKDLRRDIKRKADDAAEQTMAYGNDLVEKGSIITDNVKDTASDIGKDMKETAKDTKENAEKLVKDSAKKVNETANETMDELDK